MRNLLIFLLIFVSILASNITKAQTQFVIDKYFSSIQLSIDTNTYKWPQDKLKLNNEYSLPFFYEQRSPKVMIRFYPKNNITFNIQSSNQFEIIDSLVFVDEKYHQVQLRFNDLSKAEFLTIVLNIQDQKKTINTQLPLQAYTQTYAEVYPGDGDLFIGEEKTFEVVSNRLHNLKFDPSWKKSDKFEYRFFERDNKVWLSIIPSTTGKIDLSLKLMMHQPYIDSNKNIKHEITIPNFSLNVKGSRLSFLKIDSREIIWRKEQKEGVEIQIENHRFLQMNKTYRLETSDEKGGPLIAELFTIRRLSNDRILCAFRPYNYHRISDGFLFIKDGDEPKFITNTNIVPEPTINKISILRKGGSWENSTTIYPGESFELRIEGESLSLSNFKFEGINDFSADSSLRTNKVAHYQLNVPIDIRQKSVSIFNNERKMGISLDIQEHLKPKPFDFILLDYGGKTPRMVSEITQPILHRGTIGDVKLLIDDYFIDEEGELFGKQYIEVEVRLKNPNNGLIERYKIDQIEICPGQSSPRYFSYDGSNGCINQPVSINDYISNKTFSLDHWSTVELIIKHKNEKYGGKGYSQRIEIIKEKLVTFDVDLSIPAGLLIKKVGVDGFPGLSGISLSMVGQFSFYQKGEVQKLRPYKLGGGFLAKNAFNFNPDAERDLGIVILGSVYPTRKNSKFSFPLYAGFGYFLNEERFFYLIGPGISINL